MSTQSVRWTHLFEKAVHDGTIHKLGQAKGHHDRMVSVMYRAQRAQGREPFEIAEDPELQYHLDAVDAITEKLYFPEDQQWAGKP
jgi:hypothetical protein